MQDVAYKLDLTMKELFDKLDTSAAGKLTKGQLTEGLKRLGFTGDLQALEQQMQLSRLPELTYQDLVHLMQPRVVKGDWQEAAFQAVRDWAADNKHTLEEAFEEAGSVQGRLKTSKLQLLIQHVQPALPLSRVEQLARMCDPDRDGYVLLADWIRRFGSDGMANRWEGSAFRRLRDLIHQQKLTMLAVHKLFDIDADGSLSLAEVAHGLLRLDPSLTAKQASQLANMCDKDSDGQISAEELSGRLGYTALRGDGAQVSE